jgi:hypothetical protein
MKKIQIGHHFAKRKYKSPKMFALVDDEDYERLNKVKWSAYFNKWTRTFYARRCVEEGNKVTSEWMARSVLNAPKGMLVDHINHDTLDNRKANLRIVNKQQNQTNRGATSVSTTGCKGVYFKKRVQKYIVRLTVDGKAKQFGTFSNLEDAIKMSNQAVSDNHGEFAYLYTPSQRHGSQQSPHLGMNLAV